MDDEPLESDIIIDTNVWKQIDEVVKNMSLLSEDDRLAIINKISLLNHFFSNINVNINSLTNPNIAASISFEDLQKLNKDISEILNGYLIFVEHMKEICENKNKEILAAQKAEEKKKRKKFPFFNLSV